MEQQFDMQQIMKLARSPAGQQLIEALKRTDGSNVEKAAAAASSGDLDQAKQALSGLLKSPEIQRLLRTLEDQL
jgi:hypothetical protein